MKMLRQVYREQHEKFGKSLLGITFFGSRTIGKEKKAPDAKPSDLDVCVFLDTNNISIPLRDKFLSLMEKRFTEPQESLGLGVEPGRSVLLIPSSTENMDSFLQPFMENVANRTKKFTKRIDSISNIDWNDFMVASHFFLGTGDGLLKARRLILNAFKSDKLHGQEHFNALMLMLAHIERGFLPKRQDALPKYNYLDTIEKAEKYFLTNNNIKKEE